MTFIVLLVILYVLYYYLVIKFIDNELKTYKDWRKRVGLD
jgi:hypothetical protein